MRAISILLFLLLSGHGFGQDADFDLWTRTTDSLRQKNSLTEKHYPDKTFAGSLTGYYLADTLVFINTLADAEEAGTEYQYYIKNGSLLKVLVMAARFEASGEWAGYYANHKRNLNCRDCHSKPNCERTEIIFSTPLSVKHFPQTGERASSLPDNRVLADELTRTYRNLVNLLNEL